MCECLCQKQRQRQHLLELLSTGLKTLEVSTVTLLIKYLETFCSIIRLNNTLYEFIFSLKVVKIVILIIVMIMLMSCTVI